VKPGPKVGPGFFAESIERLIYLERRGSGRSRPAGGVLQLCGPSAAGAVHNGGGGLWVAKGIGPRDLGLDPSRGVRVSRP